jgi:hypothetical protein
LENSLADISKDVSRIPEALAGACAAYDENTQDVLDFGVLGPQTFW